MNNNEQFDKFIREFDTIRMTSDEKNKIGQNLEAFANSHVMTPSPYVAYASFFRKSLALALVAVLFVSASKPASAGSLPGELLYPVKIIHEKITAATITEPEKKVVYEIKRTETRIQEAVHLANTQKLDSDTQKKIAVDIQKQVADVSEKIEEVKQENPETALSLNSDLKTTLKVNSEALKTVTRTTKKKKKEKKVVTEVKTPEVEVEKETEDKIEVVTNNIENNDTNTLVETDIVDITTDTDEAITSVSTELSATTGTDAELTNDDIDTTEIVVDKEPATTETNEVEEKIEEDEYESFADIILDTLEEEIEDTKKTEEVIEEELVEKLDEKDNVETVLEVEKAEIEEKLVKKEVAEITKTEETIIVVPETEVMVPILPITETTPETQPVHVNNELNTLELEKLGFSPADIQTLQAITRGEAQTIPAEQTYEITPTLIAEGENLVYETSVEAVAVDVQTEIASLETILIAQAKLDALYTETGTLRSQENIQAVNMLLHTEKNGQALVAIQTEIENLNEIKLSREINTKLGIAVEQNVLENKQ